MGTYQLFAKKMLAQSNRIFKVGKDDLKVHLASRDRYTWGYQECYSSVAKK